MRQSTNQQQPRLLNHVEERHLFHRRLFVAIDEWMTYAAVLFMLNRASTGRRVWWLALGVGCVMGVAMNSYGYWSLWRLRASYGVHY